MMKNNPASVRPGHNLIVLLGLVVCAVFLASCSGKSEGLGALPKALGAADEGFAIQTLRAIASAETQMKVTRGSYGDFDALTQAGLLDQRFAGPTPNLKGYRFTITANESDFTVNADPQTAGAQAASGSRHFYLDSSENAVHANPKEPASKNDPVVGT